jgi:leucyl-tRNA synthetase
MPEALSDAATALRRHTHRAIAAVTDDFEKFGFNRAVAHVRELSNALAEVSASPDAGVAWALREGFETLVQLAAPMAPHLCEQLWQDLDMQGLVVDAPWPKAEVALLVDDSVTVAVQVNGKLRGTISLPRGVKREDAESAALALPAVTRATDGKPIRRVIVVPDKIVNVVV